jgi:DNA repair protein RecN (Recombination protein N)
LGTPIDVLDTLHIRNFALIDDLIIPWKVGLNVLTGETGAGKSIIIDAMNLLLGERAATNLIRDGADAAEIEAVFDISRLESVKELLDSMDMYSSSDELLLRRIISTKGKTSKCFLNGTIVTLSMLSKIGDVLVDIHGQHEHQSLMRADRHLALLDEFAGLVTETALVNEEYRELKRCMSELEDLIKRETSRSQRMAELREELDLLDRAELKEGEEAELRSRRNLIANAEKVYRLASEGYDMLFAGETYQPPLVNTWDMIMQALRDIGEIDSGIKDTLKDYEDMRFKFDELARMFQSYLAGLDFDPAELEDLENRLDAILRLKRRHGCQSYDELLKLAKEMRENYNRLSGLSEERTQLEREVQARRIEVGKNAFILSQKRDEAARRLEKKIEIHLRELGMMKARFVVSLRQEESSAGLAVYKDKSWKLSSTGVDAAEFLFSANVGEPPKPLRDIGSGGEISRIMLAIRTILAEADRVPVIIFDEIDAGVGASMGMAIAEKLAAVSSSHQVICVTHLPQIAAMANNHIVVDKLVEAGRTRTEIEFPQGQARAEEIARMLGGDSTGKISVKHARELLALARKSR